TNYYITKAEIDQQTGIAYTLFELIGGSTTRSKDYVVAFNSNGTQIWLHSVGVRGGLSNLRYKEGDGIYVSGGPGGAFTFSLGGLSATGAYPSWIFSTITNLDQTGIGVWLRRRSGTSAVGGIGSLELLPEYSIDNFGAFNAKAKHGL